MSIPNIGMTLLFTKAELISLIPGSTWFLVIINFLIFVIIMKKVFFKKIAAIIEQREQEIEKDLEEAKNSKLEAEKIKSDYQIKINKAQEEAAQILKERVEIGKEKANEIIENANKEALRIKDRTMREIEQDRLRAKDELKDQIGDMVILTASRFIGDNMSETDSKRLVEESISKIGEAKWME